MLSELQVGESGILIGLDLPESGSKSSDVHMGFVPDAHVTVLRRAPAGDPDHGLCESNGMEIASVAR